MIEDNYCFSCSKHGKCKREIEAMFDEKMIIACSAYRRNYKRDLKKPINPHVPGDVDEMFLADI